MPHESLNGFLCSCGRRAFTQPIDCTMPDFTPGQWVEIRSMYPEDNMGPFKVLSRYDEEEYRYGRRYNLVEISGQVIHYCPPQNKIFGHLLKDGYVFHVLTDTEVENKLGSAKALIESILIKKIKDLVGSKLLGKCLDPDNPGVIVQDKVLQERYHIQEG